MGALEIPSRLEFEIVGVLIIVAAVLMWLGFHDAAVKREATAPIIASIQAAEQAASAAQAIQEATTDATQAANLHEATTQNAARAVDARDLAGAVAGADRLRDDAIRRSATANHPAAAQGSPAGVSPGADLVPWELYAGALTARAEAERDAADLAGTAGPLRTSGGLCSGDYDALGTVKR